MPCFEQKLNSICWMASTVKKASYLMLRVIHSKKIRSIFQPLKLNGRKGMNYHPIIIFTKSS